MNSLTKGSIFILDIKKIGINGEGIGYYNGIAVFVKGAITKERIYAKVEEVFDNYVTASIDSIVEKSNRRVEPICKFYEQCGACNLQHIKDSEQLKIKRDILISSLRRYTKIDTNKINIERTEKSPSIHYRNKSQMPFRDTSFGLSLGLFQEGTNKFVYIDDCPIQNDEVNRTNELVLSVLRKYDMKTSRNGGVLEYLCTRAINGQVQVTFIVSKPCDKLADIAKEIKEKGRNIVTIAYSVKDKNSPSIFGNDVIVLEGNNYIKDEILGLKISLSPKSFYQLNREQAIKLYEEIVNIGFNESDVVFDCYSGIGILGSAIAKKTKHVYAIEMNSDSIKNAKIISRENSINNITFYSDRIESRLPAFKNDGISPNCIILDPPRSGLQDSVIKSILDVKPNKIIYVSCNPSTLAKNLNNLLKEYEIKYIRPYDFFCETALVESITVLEKK